MSKKLDEILRDFGEDYWSDIEHGDGDHSITVAEAEQAINAYILGEVMVLVKAGGYEASYEISMIEKLEAEL